jgi:hypothetical protein
MRVIALFLLLITSYVHAEVIPIKPLESCFMCSSKSSMTMYWKGEDSKAVVIFIPGGEGYIGLKEGQTDHGYYFYNMLKRLSKPYLLKGNFDVVLLDSPAELSPNQRYPAARGDFDHMIRIESAIKYYKEKTGLPVWLMGHSNGGISITEFFKYAKKNNKTDLIAGFIVSGVRSETYFDPPYTFPMLFIHHEKDACSYTPANASFKNFQKVKEINKFPTEFIYVTAGSAEPRDPCRSGYHMYFEASDEASKSIESFLLKIYP